MFTWYWLHTMRANDVRPYGLFGRVCCAAKSLRSLRIYICFGRGEAVQVYASMLVLFDVWVLCAFWICSAPLSRLTPIEALPQAPLGALPPDPHNGFHPLTLTRGVPLDLLLASLGGSFTLYGLLSLCGFVIPHSSLSYAPHLRKRSHRIPIPVQQFYNLIIIKSFYGMIVCTLRIGINSHGTSMAYLLKRILHDRYH